LVVLHGAWGGRLSLAAVTTSLALLAADLASASRLAHAEDSFLLITFFDRG
jgi:hypothetical protein